MVAALAVALALVLSVWPSPNAEATRDTVTQRSVPLELPAPGEVQSTPEEAAASTREHQDITIPWQEFKIRSGDSLSAVFQRAGLNDSDLYRLMAADAQLKVLTHIYPGQMLELQVASDELIGLRYRETPLKTLIADRNGDGYVVHVEQREPETRLVYHSATLDNSLFLAGEKAGLSQNTIMTLADIFSGVMDFVYDPRKGDTFSVLYEERYLDGHKFEDGDILAATYTNQGNTYTAYRYVDSHGNVGYYDEGGVSMRKAFMRAPLDFTRISSGFNPRRLHPIFHTRRPHNGIDYAAPVGTPVYAAGDGRVVASGYSKPNGNYIFIRHGPTYETKYIHLHKRFVKRGQRVKQHQIIGQVGATGWATGPHLHYEFLVNGVHRNPRTIVDKLPKAKSIAQAEKPRFVAYISQLSRQFAAYGGTSKLAVATPRPRDGG